MLLQYSLGSATILYNQFYRDCFFCASSAMHRNEFVQAINSVFLREECFVYTLLDVDLGNYLLEKVMEFMQEPQPRTLQAV